MKAPEDPPAFTGPLTLDVFGGGAGMALWLVLHVLAHRPEIGQIVLVDVKPLYGKADSAAATNPDRRYIEALRQLAIPIYAVLVDYTRTGPEMFVDCIPVNAAAAAQPLNPSIEEADLVMVGVPEEEIEVVAKSILSQVAPGTLVFDICSSKGQALDTIVAHVPEGVPVVGTHSLHGPAVPNPVGQTVAMCPTSRSDEDFYAWLEEVFTSAGATVQWVDRYRHDEFMLTGQSLTHYMYMIFAKTLGKLTESGFSLQESFRFSTPPYENLIAMTARVIAQNPRLYGQIQAQPGADRLRAKLVEAATELLEQFRGSRSEIQSYISDIVQPFRGSEIARALAISLPLVSAIQGDFRDLYSRSQSGKLTILAVGDPMGAADPSRLHVGQVIKVDGDSITMVERHVVRGGRSFIAYDDESAAAIARFGISARRTSHRILRQNIRRVLSDAETLEWRRNHLRHHSRDIRVLVEEPADLRYICDALTLLKNDRVVSGEVLGAGNDERQWRQYGFSNKILRFAIFGDRDPNAAQSELLKALNLLGVRTPQVIPNLETEEA